VVDLFSIGGRWCPLVVLVDSAPTGTGSEVYCPVWVILYINPEEVFPIVRTKEHTVLFNLLHNTLWVVVHQVSESVLRFVRFRSDKSEVKHVRNSQNVVTLSSKQLGLILLPTHQHLLELLIRIVVHPEILSGGLSVHNPKEINDGLNSFEAIHVVCFN
jgi:lauroyl/myristoyl acyltransferase